MMIWWIAITTLGRLVIHLPDATPTTSLALLAPLFFPLRRAILMMMASLILSDLFLHFLFHYPVFGMWSFFTYSGWVFVILLGYFFSKKMGWTQLLFFSVMGSVFFWVWTNFGTWCVTTLYPHTMSGLMACYVAGIPFLRNGLLSALVWSAVFYKALAFTGISLYTSRLEDIGVDTR